MMDVYTWFSIAINVSDRIRGTAVLDFEQALIAHFGPPLAIHGDEIFNASEFLECIKKFEIPFRPFPPWRHSKNPIKLKLRIIRGIHLHVKDFSALSDSVTLDSLMMMQVLRISNDLYGSGTLS